MQVNAIAQQSNLPMAKVIAEVVETASDELRAALAAGQPGALVAMVEYWLWPANPIGTETEPTATEPGKARLAFDDITRIVLDMELAQCRARGLLVSLSRALAAVTVSDNEAVGMKVVAENLAEHVAINWKRLNEAHSQARENRSDTVAQMNLEAALHDMVSPMRNAAACVHSLALALRQHAMLTDTFHAEGVLEGYEELAVYWPSEILLPVDEWNRPAAYSGKQVAA